MSMKVYYIEYYSKIQLDRSASTICITLIWLSYLAWLQICFRRGLPPGDGVLFYPGEVFSSSHEPVASTRLERILSGMQVRFFGMLCLC